MKLRVCATGELRACRPSVVLLSSLAPPIRVPSPRSLVATQNRDPSFGYRCFGRSAVPCSVPDLRNYLADRQPHTHLRVMFRFV
jgi:hypothetical protein